MQSLRSHVIGLMLNALMFVSLVRSQDCFVSLNLVKEPATTDATFDADLQSAFVKCPRSSAGYFDLQAIPITLLPRGLLQGMSNLKNAFFQNVDSLKQIPSDIFSGNKNLEAISFYGCPNAELPFGMFAGMSKLTHLNLGRTNPNWHSTPQADFFKGLLSIPQLFVDSGILCSTPGVDNCQSAGITVLLPLPLGITELNYTVAPPSAPTLLTAQPTLEAEVSFSDDQIKNVLSLPRKAIVLPSAIEGRSKPARIPEAIDHQGKRHRKRKIRVLPQVSEKGAITVHAVPNPINAFLNKKR